MQRLDRVRTQKRLSEFSFQRTLPVFKFAFVFMGNGLESRSYRRNDVDFDTVRMFSVSCIGWRPQGSSIHQCKFVHTPMIESGGQRTQEKTGLPLSIFSTPNHHRASELQGYLLCLYLYKPGIPSKTWFGGILCLFLWDTLSKTARVGNQNGEWRRN